MIVIKYYYNDIYGDDDDDDIYDDDNDVDDDDKNRNRNKILFPQPGDPNQPSVSCICQSLHLKLRKVASILFVNDSSDNERYTRRQGLLCKPIQTAGWYIEECYPPQMSNMQCSGIISGVT